jgi:hypothetical protein
MLGLGESLAAGIGVWYWVMSGGGFWIKPGCNAMLGLPLMGTGCGSLGVGCGCIEEGRGLGIRGELGWLLRNCPLTLAPELKRGLVEGCLKPEGT